MAVVKGDDDDDGACSASGWDGRGGRATAAILARTAVCARHHARPPALLSPSGYEACANRDVPLSRLPYL